MSEKQGQIIRLAIHCNHAKLVIGLDLTTRSNQSS